MMVPRSYTYAFPPPSPKMIYTETDLPTITPLEYSEGKAASLKDYKETVQRAQAPGVCSPPLSTPSKPVVIPTRTRRDGRHMSRGQAAAAANPRPMGKAKVKHDQTALSPSMTALLAMTSIPIPKQLSRSGGQRKVSDPTQDAKSPPLADTASHTLSSSNPQTWDFLLSPPNIEEMESASFSSDITIGPPSSVRSTDSMPSLEEDEESLCSVSDPATPSLLASGRGERKKSCSASKAEDCLMDHPLLPPAARSLRDIAEQPKIEMSTPEIRPAALRSRLSLKSNLTASFRAVRYAARSFSDWTMTSSHVHRDDHLSQSLLSLTLPYTVERRPLPSDDLPDPAIRRYLNPITLSPAELHFHALAREVNVKACIQLETYQRGNRPTQHASSPPIFASKRQLWRQDALDTEDPFTSSLLPRQREPRENSDFLRVIVLEMNMRRVGKLPGTSPGRAKLWLPARHIDSRPAAVEHNGHAEALRSREGVSRGGLKRVHLGKVQVPARWVGVTAT